MSYRVCRSVSALRFAAFLTGLVPVAARAATTSAATVALPAVHLSPLNVDSGGATPWGFSPMWFVLWAVVMPAVLWTVLAWKRALEEDPHRLRRAGSRELRRLLVRAQRAGGTPRPADLHAWFQATAHTWGVRVSTPTESEIRRSLVAFDGDASTQVRWRELWENAERRLYGAEAKLSAAWIQDGLAVANQVRIPPRKNWFPNRVRHWLPSVAAGICTGMLLAGGAGSGLLAAEGDAAPAASTRGDTAPAASTDDAARAAVKEDAAGAAVNEDAARAAVNKPALVLDPRTAAALRDAQTLANSALRADWNNWAAHYNVAAQQMIQGNADYAVAHLTAAFLQHPSSGDVQDNLRWSLQQAGTMDPTLRRLLYGAWFQRYPALLSPAGWQRLGLFAGLLIGGGLCALVFRIYTARHQYESRRIGRWSVAVGVALLAASVMSWNAWGELRRPNAAMLVEGINLSPAPTDLVKDRETLPVTAGSVALTQASFLGWQRVELHAQPAGRVTGWVRAPYVMPLYASKTAKAQ